MTGNANSTGNVTKPPNRVIVLNLHLVCDGDAVLFENLQHLGNVWRAWGYFLVEGGEHLCGHAALAGKFEHFPAAWAVAEAVHGPSGHIYQRARQAHNRLVFITEIDLTFKDIKGLVPVVTMRGRTHSFVALLQGDLIGLSRDLLREYGHLDAQHIQPGIVVIG
jgi:hypothetical protein